MRKSIRFGKIGFGALVALTVAASACTNGNDNTAPSASNSAVSELQPVELTWYYPQPNAQPDLEAVEEAVNQIIRPKINATIKLKPIDFGEYDQRMNTVAASGEAFDIAWTANWLFDYVGNVNKGVFLPLDDLLPRYAPELQTALPDFMWEQVKVGGKIYGVPNYQSVTGREGYIVPKEYADPYELDISSIKKFEDIEPFLAQIKQNNPGVSPLVMDRNGMFGYLVHSQGIGTLPITSNPPIGMYDNDVSLKLLNVYASPEYAHYLDVVRAWYLKGYINKDAPTIKAVDELAKSGKGVVTFSLSLNPGSETILSNGRYGGKPILYVPLTDFLIDSNPGISTVNAIGANSKNPERAMMFLNMVNSDKELFNTLAYGVEGKHYSKVGENTIKINDKCGYNPHSSFVYGNTFNGFLLEGQSPDIYEVQKKTNEQTKPTLVAGFKFDASPVATEIANVQSVLDEYLPGLNTGAVDPAKKLPDFLDRLQKAGIDKFLQEAQKQIDAWKMAK
ncbi:extracellular solute-binding protein [Cohnella endophytica]|uniref:Extracellular solute-binding protein n=1 Tax=Cohnella endophytica TaxID=2419778 RepID=A0A494XP16_9BACL|nr:ABC transporter substrate-binding protein [Cohnella endophytica]RKP49869.1 extracellular solute-binding protein [Cohnella endophytica]